MLTSKAKPSRILPGDEHGHFGGPGITAPKSPKKDKKKKKRKGSTPMRDHNDGFSYGFDGSSGLSSTGELVNPFGDAISDFDIEVSWDVLSNLSADKRITIDAFTTWINFHLQLNWDESRIKRAWAALDQDKLKYITFKEFKSGLKSTNSDVVLFYHNLMKRTDVHPFKARKEEWDSLGSQDRIKRIRVFCPRALRKFARPKKGKKKRKHEEYQEFLELWRKSSVDFLHNDFWAKNEKGVAMCSSLYQKMCNLMGQVTYQHGGSDQKYGVLTYEFFIYVDRFCTHQPFVSYMCYKHMTLAFIQCLNTYDLSDSNCQGKVAWVTGAMISMIKNATRPTTSLTICNYLADQLLDKLGSSKITSAEELKTDDDSIKVPNVWNECCKHAFIDQLCNAIDCTESEKAIIKIKGKEGGMNFIKKISTVCLYIFTRAENNAFASVLEVGYKLLSRLDAMSGAEHDKVLKKMTGDQRKRYNRHFGQARLVRFTSTANVVGGKGRRDSAGGSKIKPGYGTSTPSSPQQYTQKYRIGTLGATVAMNKIKKGMGSVKSRIIDVTEYSKLYNPFEFHVEEEDVLAAFRYADVNQDNAISFTDFTQSLMKVGVIKDDEEAKEMWCVLNPSKSSRGVNLVKFQQKLTEYPKELHNWLCRIISCNHLARQPFKTDPDPKSIKKILKDQRKLTWKERIDALHAVARLFARTNDTKKEFQGKFSSFLPRLLAHLKDPHALCVRASCVALTKIMMYKNGSMTKYIVKIMDGLTVNFSKKDLMITESSFGCFANLVRHVPDTKKYATLQHIRKLVTTKNVSIRCMGYKVAGICFERILGLRKARPSSWWAIAEDILEAGMKERSKIVQADAICLLYVFKNSPKHDDYVRKYIQYFAVPTKQAELVKNKMISGIQERMDEYHEEAAKQADALDVYSLISTEPEEEKDTDEKASPFAFVDDIMDDKPVMRDPLENRGLGTRLILHKISRDEETIREVYELYDIGQQIENTRTILASLKYLGISIGRGELTLILSEIKMILEDREDAFTVDKYAFFVKHCFGTLDVAWSTYLKQLDMDEVDIVDIANPKKVFSEKVEILRQLCDAKNKNLEKKCEVLGEIYSLFVTPELEDDEVLFEEMMEELNPIILTEIKENMHCTILCQEICLFVCRIAQFHISRFADYGGKYYNALFQIMGYGSNIVAHCCAKTCLVMASMVSFLNEPSAESMTTSLVRCTNSFDESDKNYWMYIEVVYKCLLAECLVNVPLTKDEHNYVREEVVHKIWSCMKNKVYQGVAKTMDDGGKVRALALNILAYMHSAEYLGLERREKDELTAEGWEEVQAKKELREWNTILRQDIEANETAPFNDLAMQHGWDNLQYYSHDFKQRNRLLEEWYDLELKSGNPIGIAAVTQLIKALNHMQYKASKTQTRPDNWDPNAPLPDRANTQKVQDTDTNGAADNIGLTPSADQAPPAEKKKKEGGPMSALAAHYLAQQRQQNQAARQVPQ